MIWEKKSQPLVLTWITQLIRHKVCKRNCYLNADKFVKIASQTSSFKHTFWVSSKNKKNYKNPKQLMQILPTTKIMVLRSLGIQEYILSLKCRFYSQIIKVNTHPHRFTSDVSTECKEFLFGFFGVFFFFFCVPHLWGSPLLGWDFCVCDCFSIQSLR